jgi:hypothetical protein
VDESVERIITSRRRPSRGFVAAAILLAFGAGCRGEPNAVVTVLTDARRLAADLRIEFNRASDASDRAVMADTDRASVAFAHEADQIKGQLKTDFGDLASRLRILGYAAEIKALEEFGRHLEEYEEVDRGILELAVENTNLKAQRLSFGPAREAADAFRDSLAILASSAAPKDRCLLEPLVFKAVTSLREIQVLQAPHIAESDDAVMTRMEKQMAALEATARDAVSALSARVDPKARPAVATALAALDRFAGVSKEIVKLSRRNSNVRSLELSLRRKPALTAACDNSLHVLQDALAKEAFTATR